MLKRSLLSAVLLACSASLFSQPVIRSFLPLVGGPGVVVTLSGTNFSGVTAVSFGGVTASFTVVSDTVITARVGSGGASGMVKVTSSQGADSLGGFYFSTKVPVITGVFPYTGPVGTVVTIKGGNFDPLPSRDTVYFGGVKAYVSSATANYLTVSVPTGAVYAPISVTANGLTTYSNPFIPVYTGGGNIDTNSFGPPARYIAGVYPRTVTTADFDGDGRSDLAGVVVGSNQVAVLRNNSQSGAIYFGSPDTFATGTSPFYIATADFNGDGKPDIVVTDQGADSISVLQNSSVPGTIAFMAKFDLPTGSAPRNLATADLDGDGMVDIVTIDGSDSVAVFLNTTAAYGAMSFAARMDLRAGAGAVGIALGDLDGDGRPDMVICDSLSNQFLVFRNTSVPGAISFSSPSVYATGGGPGAVAIGDLDGDGKPDVIISNPLGGNLLVFRNRSTLSTIGFASPVTFNAGSGAAAISISDVNGDGKPDITLADGQTNEASVLQNISTAGGIVFSPVVLFAAGGSPAGIVAGDFDGDGRPDIALANYSGTPSASISVLHSLLGQLRYPAIDSFAPSSGKRGDTITIHGHFLTGASAVSFGSVAAVSYTVVSDSVISAVLGAGASGLVQVSTGYGSTNRGGFRFLYSSPIVRSFSPDSGATGDTITVKGNFLTGTKTLLFGKVPATSLTVLSDTVVVAVVGSGATGYVDLTTPGGSDSLGGFVFVPRDTVVTPPPHDTIPPPDTVPPPVVPPDSVGSGHATVFQLLDFTAIDHAGQVELQWLTADDSMMAYYVVQYSSDSVSFDGIGSVRAKGMDTANYSFADGTHRTGASYYRLKIEDTALGVMYSPVVAVRPAGPAEMITVFPNPASDEFTAVVPGTINNSGFELVDMAGRIVVVMPVKAGVSQVSFVVRALNRGVYKLIWTDGVNKAFRTLLIIRR
ncbi:MAG TPA: FG-GAP-like repeat-containing protein [Puia sp.]|nr:FG-GAP-like repeat-containing protein [Puia sp.]